MERNKKRIRKQIIIGLILVLAVLAVFFAFLGMSKKTARSLGKPVDQEIALINERTLADPESKMVDILDSPATISGETVRKMMDSYSFPEDCRWEEGPATASDIAELTEYRNIDAIPEQISIQYAICTENGSIRSFPTSRKLIASVDDFDMLQETGLNYADGMLVYHRTKDGCWAFVQAVNYYGWIDCSQIAFTDADMFRSYLSPDHFIINLTSGTSPGGRDRMGVILPYTGKEHTKEGTVYSAQIPVRTEDGSLSIETEKITADCHNTVSDGFLPYSSQRVCELANTFLGTKYEWGDMENGYDCSSTTGAVYRCFGIYCPRNTDEFPALGLNVLDTRQLSQEDKYVLIKEHPGCIVLMDTHIGIGLSTGEVIHNVPVYRATAGGEIINRGSCIRSDFRYTFTKENTPYFDEVYYIIYF